jgi:hypothetical protein
VFDGRYVYFVPFGATGNSAHVVQYDTQGTFTTAGSWATFDITTVSANATGFTGGIFDGRYIYFVPHGPNGNIGLVARYDTQAAFTSAVSWSVFDATTVSAQATGFASGGFDGRFLYLVPFGKQGESGVILRYDTLAVFSDANSWGSFDITSLNPSAHGFSTCGFDGRYLYFAPLLSLLGDGGVTLGHVTARFDAKSPPSVPDTYKGGSFF